MPVSYIIELIIDIEDGMRGAIELISHFVENSNIEENVYVFGLACEIVSSGRGVINLIDKELDTTAMTDESQEVAMLQPTLEILQNLVISNYYASRELNRTFYSTAIH